MGSVPDIYYEFPHEEIDVDHQYYSAFLVGVLEALMPCSSSKDKSWSQEALDFSLVPPTNSLAPFANVSFLLDQSACWKLLNEYSMSS